MLSSSNIARPIIKVLVTGANGFIGKNLVMRLSELPHFSVFQFVRSDTLDKLEALLIHVDVLVHLAGENRPDDDNDFERVNKGLTESICNALSAEYKRSGRQPPLIFASSVQADRDNPYGKSKLAGEKLIESLFATTGHPALIYRLPGVFGKWCKPNYNSVVATFCYNLARGLPIQVNDPTAVLELVYIDDVVTSIIAALNNLPRSLSHGHCTPIYKTTVGELAKNIGTFDECRNSLIVQRVGAGFLRALYATYLSYFPLEHFSYELPVYADPRGVFVEILKTQDSGQISYFSVLPGITRGGHYHHTKSEKFLVIKGRALFRFRHLLTGQLFELTVSGDKPQVLDTIPGWAHDITNVGDDEMMVMLWANEIFDRTIPDTVASKV